MSIYDEPLKEVFDDEPKVRHYRIAVEIIEAGEDAVHIELANRGVPTYDELGSDTVTDIKRGYPNPYRVDKRGRVKVATVLWKK